MYVFSVSRIINSSTNKVKHVPRFKKKNQKGLNRNQAQLHLTVPSCLEELQHGTPPLLEGKGKEEEKWKEDKEEKRKYSLLLQVI